MTWLFGSLNRILQVTGRNIFWVMVLHTIFVPLQGAFNFLVYKYPRYYKWKEKRRKARKSKKEMAQAEGGDLARPKTESVAVTKRFSGIDYDDGLEENTNTDVTPSAKHEEKMAEEEEKEEEKSPDV